MFTDIDPDYLVNYTKALEYGLSDKLFFLKHLEPNAILDYGCANGALLAATSLLCPNIRGAGYDINKNMIKWANKELGNDRFHFSTEWDDVKHWCVPYGSTLVLSSVIHEILHYQPENEIEIFWSRIFGSTFDYIVIRDMLPSRSICTFSSLELLDFVRREFDEDLLNEFEFHWGSLNQNKNLQHFLLKSKWLQGPNKNREMKENYFGIYLEELLLKIPDNYELMFIDTSIPEHVQRNFLDWSGSIKTDSTHAKIILKRKP